MNRLSLRGCLVVALACCTASAAAPALVPGEYSYLVGDQLMLLSVADDGTATSRAGPPLLTTDGTIRPVDPIDPVDPTTFAGKLTAQARAINEPEVTAAVAATWRFLQQQIESGAFDDRNGKLDVSLLNGATRFMLDKTLSTSSKKTQWAALRKFIADEFVERTRAGSLGSKSQYRAAYGEIAESLEKVGDTSAINIAFWLQLLRLLFEFWQNLPKS